MTLSKNGKKLGRPRGSKTKVEINSVKQKDRLVQANVIAAQDQAIKNLQAERGMLHETIQRLRKDLSEAQIAVLDGVAVIRYLEKKVYDLVKAEKK